jgi:hypothetical protein
VEARQVDPRFRHQRCQPGNEVEGRLAIARAWILMGMAGEFAFSLSG